MKRVYFSFILLLAIVINISGQVTDGEGRLRDIKNTEDTGWDKGAIISLNTAQTSLTNWMAGGQNSISFNSMINAHLNYGSEKYLWENTLDFGYGIIKQGKSDFFKSDDKIELNSKLGIPISEKLKAAGLVNFKSQMSEGYPRPEDLTLISDLLSPAYLLGAIGIDTKMSPGLSVFIAPITGKMTLVQNEILVAIGSFGLDPGKSLRTELGGYLRAEYTGELMKNVSLQTKLDLFSNYLDGPQYVDVNWGVLLMMQINKVLSASINMQLIYDHDILIGMDTTGDDVQDDFKPRVQFKEILGIGLTIKL
ncbi:MAG: DUF3078 domain-containing protein [Bacteroidales bacterium]|nr:DUF3078 domain-containing protein [Bacteroidales bacterium]